ncbi:MAG TPA: DUF3800 domain-containing protein [Thermoanaerobaculia bacterium]|nr:DUF3800 domain-containing protein [Thermoanaerobaculia bacterium]
MAFLLFMDESGGDLRDSPREVLAGIAIEDRDLWNFITAVQAAEVDFFGRRISEGALELKGKKLLKAKVFRLAAQLPAIDAERRRQLALSCLQRGEQAGGDPGGGNPTREELTALAQAKIAFVEQVFVLCARFQGRAFASIVPRDAPRTAGDFLRKDYAYLFERYFYFLEDRGADTQGLVIFDELEKAASHVLLDQMARYFRETGKGRMRAARVVPEPFFVHSDLTTAIQVADLIAYVTAWGVALGPADELQLPPRPELAALGRRACELRYRAVRALPNFPEFVIWSFALIDDLRPYREQMGPL